MIYSLRFFKTVWIFFLGLLALTFSGLVGEAASSSVVPDMSSTVGIFPVWCCLFFQGMFSTPWPFSKRLKILLRSCRFLSVAKCLRSFWKGFQNGIEKLAGAFRATWSENPFQYSGSLSLVARFNFPSVCYWMLALWRDRLGLVILFWWRVTKNFGGTALRFVAMSLEVFSLPYVFFGSWKRRAQGFILPFYPAGFIF